MRQKHYWKQTRGRRRERGSTYTMHVGLHHNLFVMSAEQKKHEKTGWVLERKLTESERGRII